MKKLGQAITVFLLMGLFFTTAVSADTEELSINERKSLIVEVAREYDIPPEIMIAIAYKESGFKQFENGKVFESTNGDGGYGIMQITDKDYVTEEVKNSTRANIEAGAKILNEKWEAVESGRAPSIQTKGSEPNNRDIIEHWYFAIMAYNGLVEFNLPKGEEEAEERGYQEHVFQYIRNFGLLELADTSFINFEKDEDYEVINDDGIVTFNTNTITFDAEGTYTNMDFNTGDQVFVINRNTTDFYGNFYNSEEISQVTSELPYYTKLKVLNDELIFNPNNPNGAHYGYYKVENGNSTGYISSSNLNLSAREKTNFTEFNEMNTDPQVNPPETVQPNKTFTVNFNEADILEDSVNKRNIYIVSEAGQGIQSSLKPGNKSVEVNPDEDLVSGQTYTLYVKDIASKEGVMTTPIQHTFTVQ